MLYLRRPLSILLALVLLLMTAAISNAGKPPALQDITKSPQGRQLAAESADRFTSYGVPTTAADLRVMQDAAGQTFVVPGSTTDLAVAKSTGASQLAVSALATVGSALVDAAPSGPEAQASAGEVSVAAAPYWTLRESGCFSLPIDSARFDNCYRIYQLINDGVPSKDYWALRMWGTGFESGAGMSRLWLSGERQPNTNWQNWEDWSPSVNYNNNCITRWVGIDVIVSIGQNYEQCEKWTISKSANGTSPYFKNQWDCNWIFCSIAQDTRQVAYAIEVSLSPGLAPRFRIGYGMSA